MWLGTLRLPRRRRKARSGDQWVVENSSCHSDLDASHISETSPGMAVRIVRKRRISGDIRARDATRTRRLQKSCSVAASGSFPLGSRQRPICQGQTSATAPKRLELKQAETRTE
jgi:hypothetical protein